MAQTQLGGKQIGPLDLTTEVTGVLPIANGGTGASSITSAGIVDTTSAQVQTNKTVSDTLMGEIFDAQKVQRDTVLLASNDFAVLDVMEIGATTALEIPSTSSVEVLTYPRRGNSGSTTVPGATFTLNTDLYVDGTYMFSSMGAALALTLTGNPRLGQTLMLGFRDDGSARAITYSSNTSSTGVATLLATTAAGKQHWMGLKFDGRVWACLAVDATGY